MTTLADVIRAGIDSALLNVHTALPAVVETFDPGTQLVSVQPLIRRQVRDTTEMLPVISNVPVATLSGGGFAVTVPIQRGDIVLLVFCESSLEQWLDSGEISNPVDIRRHGLDGAVAYPGVYSKNRAIPAHSENLVVGRVDGSQIHIRPDDVISLGEEDADDWVGLASKIDENFQELTERLDEFFETYSTHSHYTMIGETTPPDVDVPPLPPPHEFLDPPPHDPPIPIPSISVDGVASSVVKVKS